MSWPSGCQKIGKIFVKLGQQEFLGRRIHSGVAGSGVAPGSTLASGVGAWSGRRREGRSS